jgi:hypothetical protein
MGTPTITSDPSVVSESAFPSCITAVPGKYGYVPPSACNANYLFNPSFAGNLGFAVVFGLSFTLHFIEAILFKKVGPVQPRLEQLYLPSSKSGG